MRTSLLLVTVTTVALATACIEQRHPCKSGDRVFELGDLEACPTGYADEDGDGYGDPEAPLFDGRECGTTPGVSCNDGDCQDLPYEDPRQNNPFPELSYPGNLEVCDGIDNDCDPETWVDEHGEQWRPRGSGTWTLTCGIAADFAFFGPESSLLHSEQVLDFDPDTWTLRVTEGTQLAGGLALRLFRARELSAIVKSSLVWSGDPDQEFSLPPYTNDCQEPDLGACMDRHTLDLELEVPAYRQPPEEPAQAEEPNVYYLTFLSTGTCRSDEVYALSSWEYCCRGTCVACPQATHCTPVTGDLPSSGSPGVGVGDDMWPSNHQDTDHPNGAPLDQPHLKEIDLLGCHRYGATYLPHMVTTTGPDGGPCNDPMNDPTCIRNYALSNYACAYVKVVVEPAD